MLEYNRIDIDKYRLFESLGGQIGPEYKDRAYNAVVAIINSGALPAGLNEYDIGAMVRAMRPSKPVFKGIRKRRGPTTDIQYVAEARHADDYREYMKFPVYDAERERLVATNGHILSMVTRPEAYADLTEFTWLDVKGNVLEGNTDSFGTFPDYNRVIPTGEAVREPVEVTITNDMITKPESNGDQTVHVEGHRFKLGYVNHAAAHGESFIFRGSRKYGQPSLISPVDKPSWETVIMPIKDVEHWKEVYGVDPTKS